MIRQLFHFFQCRGYRLGHRVVPVFSHAPAKHKIGVLRFCKFQILFMKRPVSLVLHRMIPSPAGNPFLPILPGNHRLLTHRSREMPVLNDAAGRLFIWAVLDCLPLIVRLVPNLLLKAQAMVFQPAQAVFKKLVDGARIKDTVPNPLDVIASDKM